MKKENAVLSEKQKKHAFKSVTVVSVFSNIFLAALKLIAGMIGHSSAMLSDAVHTLSDVLTTLIACIGVCLSRKEADQEHPYGHERFECVASMLLAMMLFVTGIGIGWGCIGAIANQSYLEQAQPSLLAVVGAVASIVVKEGMFWYTMYYAKKLNSGAFKADAWHHRSDALSSVGALAGIIGARHGFLISDQIASMIICIIILCVAIGVFKDAMEKMLDTSCGEQFETELKKVVSDFSQSIHQEIGVDLIRTRKFGEKIYVEMEISMNGDLRLKDAHSIAENLHDHIENQYPDIKHVMIHVNPAGYHD